VYDEAEVTGWFPYLSEDERADLKEAVNYKKGDKPLKGFLSGEVQS
jgi:hypothetical protein